MAVSTQEVIVVNPAATSVVVVSGTAVGPQGTIGATGPQGTIGATGPQGIAGTTNLSIINVLDYGAVGDGTTDDTTAIQNAINACPAGGIVWFPAKTFRVTAPIILLPTITLEGTHGNRVFYNSAPLSTPQPSMIKAASTFSGSAVIRMLDKEEGGYANESTGQRITNLTIDGSAISSGTIRGIYATGNVREVIIHNVAVQFMPHNGIAAGNYTRTDSSVQKPYSWYVTETIARSCGNFGFSVGNMSDSNFVSCQSLYSGVSGWFISNNANTVFTNCRSEWSGQHGFYVTGSWGTSPAGSGGAVFTGCTTDRSNYNGFYVDATGNGPITFNGCYARRDGRNGNSGGGSYAGFKASAATVPVLVDSLVTYPGNNDDTTGTVSPQYGASFNGNSYVSVSGASFLHGVTTGFYDGGSNTVLRRGPNIGERTGSPSSPTNVYQNNWSMDNSSNLTTNGTGTFATVSATTVTATTVNATTVTAATLTATTINATTVNATAMAVTATASAPTDVANKAYVDAAAGGAYNAGVGITKSGSSFLIQSSGNTLNPTANNLDLTSFSQINSTGNTSANIVQGVTVDSYGRVTGVTSGSHTLASTTIAGISSFNNSNFTVTSGAVAAKAITLTAGSGISLSTTTVNLNDSVTITNAGVLSFAGATGAVTVATSNGATVTTTGSQINIGLTQNLQTAATPTFAGLTISALGTATAPTVVGTTATFTGTGTFNAVTATTVTATTATIGTGGITSSSQVAITTLSTSVAPLIIKPAGSLTFTGLSANHSGGIGQAYDTISGFSSTTGLVVGQAVTLSGFSNANFNSATPTTVTSVGATTIQVTSLNQTNGSGTGGQIVVTSTLANLQEWQQNNGTAVASVSPNGTITAPSFSGSGASLTNLNGANLTTNSVPVTKLESTAQAPSLWYSPLTATTSATLSAVGAAGTTSAANFIDPFGLTNGVTVGINKTYYVEYVFVGNCTHTASTSTGIRVYITGDAVTNIGFDVMQASLATSPNGNWATTTNYSSYVNAINTNYQVGGSVTTGTSVFFKLTLRGIMRTGATGSYFQPKLGLSTVSVSGTSTMTIARESYASLIELGTSSADRYPATGLWS